MADVYTENKGQWTSERAHLPNRHNDDVAIRLTSTNQVIN